VILVAGGIIGGGITARVLHKGIMPRRPNPRSFSERMRERMKRDLGLTTKQAKQIERITKTRMAAVRAIQKKIEPQVDAEIEQMQKEIGDVLNEEQKPKWEDRVKRFWEMTERMRQGRGFRGGKGGGRPGWGSPSGDGQRARPGRHPRNREGVRAGKRLPEGRGRRPHRPEREGTRDGAAAPPTASSEPKAEDPN